MPLEQGVRFSGGAAIAWRNCVRLSPTSSYEPSYACAMTVVHDREGDLALYRGPGYPMRRRNAEHNSVPGFRHQPTTRHLDGWSVDRDWGRWHVVVLMDPCEDASPPRRIEKSRAGAANRP